MLEKDMTWAIVNKYGVRPMIGSQESVERKNKAFKRTNPDLHGVVKLVRIEYHEACEEELQAQLKIEAEYKKIKEQANE